jgi:tetratricopeptide (TPR) repeat protein
MFAPRSELSPMVQMAQSAIAVRSSTSLWKQSWKWLLPMGALVAALLGFGWRYWQVRRNREALAEAKADIRANRQTTAARKLADLLAWKPDCDEAAYLLGSCERAKGRLDAAEKAWLRVSPGSPFGPQAILGRIELEVERGRFAAAEELVETALKDPRLQGSDLPILLGPVYCQQGRVDDAKRLLELRWNHLHDQGEGASEKAINLVRLHIELDRKKLPIELIRSALDAAGRKTPDDDRVWLGRADLAICTHAYDEAAQWLDACLKARPNDVAVWRTRLNWALATSRPAEVKQALDRLPADSGSPAQILRLAAWQAAHRGDHAAERHALDQLVAIEPRDAASRDRLIELALQMDQPARAQELRRRAAEIDELAALYYQKLDRNQPLRDAAEMAGIAARLGREFEARVFLTVAIAVDPDRDDLRRDLDRLEQSTSNRGANRTGRSLADVVGSLLAGQ